MTWSPTSPNQANYVIATERRLWHLALQVLLQLQSFDGQFSVLLKRKKSSGILDLLGIYIIPDQTILFSPVMLPCAISCKTEVFTVHRRKIVPVIITLLCLYQINLGLLSMFCLLTVL